MKKREYITDVESYWNYFLLASEDVKSGEQFEYSLRGRNSSFSPAQRRELRRYIIENRHYTFNGRNYDALIMTAASLGYTVAEMKKITNFIIEKKQKSWDVERKYGFKVPDFDHVDLIEVAFGRASLKIYNGRRHGKRLQDLPYPPESMLNDKQMDNVCDYCFNDLDATRNVMNAVRGQLDLRITLGKQHGIDLRSKSDAQVAEAIIKKEMIRRTGRCDKAAEGEWYEGKEFYYNIPKFIKFRSKKLNDLLDLIYDTPLVIGKGGYVNLPNVLKEKIRINEGVYTLGIGGIHSNEKCTTHVADEDYILRDSDVTSYYPSIILALRLFPKQLGKVFLTIYEKIVKDRVHAKGQMQEIETLLKEGRINDPDRIEELKTELVRWQIAADGGKIMVNGSFGKFGSKWSILYSPPLLIQTTLTGQLSLLMLIEALEDIGIQVVSANTDGIIAKIPRWMEYQYKEVLDWWQKTTGFNMEFTDYSGVYSRDVNSYIAVGTNGKVKTKGAYSMGAMSNNPQTEICIEAAINHITGKKSIIGTIKECQDIRKFITLRTVNGGAIWPCEWFGEYAHETEKVTDGEYLGKAIRWYYAKDVTWAIHYVKPTKSGTHNKVPKTVGARPIMEFTDTPESKIIKDKDGKPVNPYMMPKDIDHSWYMRRAWEILEEIGLEENPYAVDKRTRKKKEEDVAEDFVAPDKYGIAAGMVA